MPVDPSRFAKLRYDDYKSLATDERLSLHERVGAPDSYYEGRQAAILQDIRLKLPNLDTPERRVIDIGCGCGALVFELISLCRKQGHLQVLVDSDEVLAQLPDEPHIRKVGGRFPQESATSLSDLVGSADVVIAYSLLHNVVLDANPFDFLDKALNLLAPGGQLLLADIPNMSMRRRFFSSDAGKAFHRSFTGTDTDPEVVFNTLEFDKIDDSVLIGLMMRARAAGFDAYIVPQSPNLPFANRREDLLCRRP